MPRKRTRKRGRFGKEARIYVYQISSLALQRLRFIALYDYEQRTKEDLSFKKGEKLEIIEKVRGWLRNEHKLCSYLRIYCPSFSLFH